LLKSKGMHMLSQCAVYYLGLVLKLHVPSRVERLYAYDEALTLTVDKIKTTNIDSIVKCLSAGR